MRCPRPALAEASPHRLGFSRRTCPTPQLYLLPCPQNNLGTRRQIMEQPTLAQCQQNNADEEDEIPQPTQQPTPADNSNGGDQPSQEGDTPQPPGGPGGGGDGGGGTPFTPPLPPGPPHAPWPDPGDGGPPAPPPGPPPADQPEPDPVNQPYDGGGHVRERLRPKESDEVNILAFPTGSQWRAWRANTFASIVSAAGRQGDLGSKLGLERRDGRPSRAGIPR